MVSLKRAMQGADVRLGIRLAQLPLGTRNLFDQAVFRSALRDANLKPFDQGRHDHDTLAIDRNLTAKDFFNQECLEFARPIRGVA